METWKNYWQLWKKSGVIETINSFKVTNKLKETERIRIIDGEKID